MEIKIDEGVLLEQMSETALLEELGRRLIKGITLIDVNKTTGKVIVRNCGMEVLMDIPPSVSLNLEGDALRDAFLYQVFNDIDLVCEYEDATQFIEEYCPDYEGKDAVNTYRRYRKEYQDMLQVMTPLDIEILCNYYRE